MAARIDPSEDDNPFGQPFSSEAEKQKQQQRQKQMQISSPDSGRPGASSPGTSGLSGPAPELLNKFEGGADDVNAAVLIPGQNDKAVITISSDR